jgi:hypothetical protein
VVGCLGGGEFGWWAVWRLRESRAVDSRPSRKEKMQGDWEWVGGQEPGGLGLYCSTFSFLLSDFGWGQNRRHDGY